MDIMQLQLLEVVFNEGDIPYFSQQDENLK